MDQGLSAETAERMNKVKFQQDGIGPPAGGIGGGMGVWAAAQKTRQGCTGIWSFAINFIALRFVGQIKESIDENNGG